MNANASHNLLVVRKFAQLSREQLAAETHTNIDDIIAIETKQKEASLKQILIWTNFFCIPIETFLSHKIEPQNIIDIISSQEEVYAQKALQTNLQKLNNQKTREYLFVDFISRFRKVKREIQEYDFNSSGDQKNKPLFLLKRLLDINDLFIDKFASLL